MKKINLKNIIIGEDQHHICIPLVGKSREAVNAECENILHLLPDIIEWRADFFKDVKETQKVVETLGDIRKILPEYPLIFTCRIPEEGGRSQVAAEDRKNLIKSVIRTGWIDVIDVELSNGREFISEVLEEAHQHDVLVIVSYHNFEETPPRSAIMHMFSQAQDLGADIAKVAVMPLDLNDVLLLMGTALDFKEVHAKIPLIAISMSDKGTISRTCGPLFGSCLTFASGGEPSAPGQIHIDELRASIDLHVRTF